MDERTTIEVILVKPMELAEVVEIKDSLEAMQELVGGYIEEYMPFDDEVAIICNDEGKLMGLPLNRGIADENGMLQEIIAGPFFICYAPVESEKFMSMPEELKHKYLEKFREPELFFRNEQGEIFARKVRMQPVKEQRGER